MHRPSCLPGSLRSSSTPPSLDQSVLDDCVLSPLESWLVSRGGRLEVREAGREVGGEEEGESVGVMVDRLRG